MVDPEPEVPIRRTRTTRRVVLTRPHQVRRSPADDLAVWGGRRRSFALAALGWLVLGLGAAVSGAGGTLVVLSLVAALLSAAVVVKAQ
ncbi:MAG: hypothetical protein QOD68_2763, partial [Actinomycetota bacterium]|nr:hypothetical protein [Actinomycetota bacterium]